MSEVIYAGSLSKVALRGNSGELLTLPIGSGTAVGTFEWSPTDRRVMDLEVRIRVNSAPGATVTSTYRVLYTLELGAGESNFSEPPPKIFNAVDAAGDALRVLEYELPARGMQFRINCRRLKLKFRATSLGGVVPTELRLMVSVQPALSATVPQVPAVSYVRPRLAAAGTTCGVYGIPMSALEWRTRQTSGLPWAVGLTTMEFFALPGALVAAVLLSDANDYLPIPADAAFYRMGTPVPTPTGIIQFR